MFAEFFMQNWALFLALFVVMGLLMFDPGSARAGSARGVSPMELTRLVNHEQAVIIDVRSPEEFDKGHITKAKNIPLDEIENKSKQLEKFKKRPMVIVCQTGNRAGKAANQLRKLEFDKLFQLTGGLVEWQKDNLPLEKTKHGSSKAAKSTCKLKTKSKTKKTKA